MPSWICWDYRCQTCDHIETHMQDRGDVSDTEYCVQGDCNGVAIRMYGGFVSTSKVSASIPDGTTTRFSGLRHQSQARKNLALAKQGGDPTTIKLARSELAQVKRSRS